MNIYVDIHIHPTLKPFLANNINDPWNDYTTNDPAHVYNRTTQFSRANFNALFASNTRLVCHYITVLERYLLSKIFTQPAIMARLLNLDIKKLREISATKPFTILQQEFEFLKSHQYSPDKSKELIFIKNYAQIEEVLKDKNKIGIILSIEGAHCLGFEYSEHFAVNSKAEPPEPLSIELIDERLNWFLNNGFKFITLNHFVFNYLATMPKVVELNGIKKIIKNPITTLNFLGDYRGLTFLGNYFVQKCLQNKIVIDIKHCDAVTRQQIYHLSKEYKFPIVASHFAVSGKETNVQNHQLITKEDKSTERAKSEKFNPWDINFHDDDILAIHQLGGLMGIIMDRRVLSSEKLLAKFLKEKLNQSLLIYYQIEHIYNVLVKNGIDPSKAFDSIAIGSDFDGLIEPIYSCTSVRDYPKLELDLISFFEMNYDKFKDSGLTPYKIVSKFMRENVLNFLKKIY
jgi:microsomal dipeptidase-like Zn-dependent dipeptidase